MTLVASMIVFGLCWYPLILCNVKEQVEMKYDSLKFKSSQDCQDECELSLVKPNLRNITWENDEIELYASQKGSIHAKSINITSKYVALSQAEKVLEYQIFSINY